MTFDFGAIIDSWNGFPVFARAPATLLVGWLIALLARTLIQGILTLLRFDRLAARVGIQEFLRKGRVAYKPSRLVGVLAFWMVLLATVLATAKVLDISVISQFSDNLMQAVPSILAAALVVGVGIVLVIFLGNVVETILRNAAFQHSRLAVGATRWTGAIFVILLAIDQLGLGQGLISEIFLIAFAALALALALAFGIGSAELAREAMRDLIKNLRERERGSHGADLEG